MPTSTEWCAATNRHALLGAELQFSYAQLNRRLDQLCIQLGSMGVSAGMVIASATHSRQLNLLLLHALPRLGCVFLPLNPALPASGLRHLLVLGEADWLLANDELTTGVSRLSVQTLLQEAVDSEKICEYPQALTPDQVQLLVATSGTQGKAKLVALNGRQVSSSVRAATEHLEFSAGDSWLLCLPLFHVGGLMIPLRCADAGATLVMHERFDVDRVWQDLHRYEISHISLVPAMLAKLLEKYTGQSMPSTLRVMLVGGDSLDPLLAQKALQLGWPVCPSYGMTETASHVATLYPPPADYAAGQVGKVLPHMQLRIDPASGRILLKGKSLMQGYLGEAPLADDWFVTSDLGQLDELGNLTVIGRADEMLIRGGENVHPQQVEHYLMQYPGVQDVAVFGMPDAAWGDRLTALYVGDLCVSELTSWCSERLPRHMQPDNFIQVECLPRTALGKLQRRELPGLLESVD